MTKKFCSFVKKPAHDNIRTFMHEIRGNILIQYYFKCKINIKLNILFDKFLKLDLE